MFEFAISLSGDQIEARSFLEAVASAVKLLRSVDKGQAIRWRLATLRYSSPATIGFVGEARTKKTNYRPEDVGHTVMAGLESLENGKPPRGFSDESLELAKKLADLKGHGGIVSVVVTAQNGVGPTATIPVTPRTAATVDDMIGSRYQSHGSIAGRLEVVSSHGGSLKCNVYEKILGKPVRCDVPAQLKMEVLNLFDQEVIVFGVVSRDSSGRPRHIALEAIRPVELASDLPQSLAGLAPDFTADVDSVDYIKKRWQ